MATIKVTLEGTGTTEAVIAIPEEARFLAWIASAYADAGETPAEHLEAWWAATVAGTAANVQRWEQTAAAQAATSAVQEMLTPPVWKAGLTVEIGETYYHEGTIYSVTQAHTTQAGWEPPAVPALFSAQ